MSASCSFSRKVRLLTLSATLTALSMIVVYSAGRLRVQPISTPFVPQSPRPSHEAKFEIRRSLFCRPFVKPDCFSAATIISKVA